jgi:hypothetical protein
MLLLNSQKRAGSGSGSTIRKNAGSRSTLNQWGSETLLVTHTPKYDSVTVSVHELMMPTFAGAVWRNMRNGVIISVMA